MYNNTIVIDLCYNKIQQRNLISKHMSAFPRKSMISILCIYYSLTTVWSPITIYQLSFNDDFYLPTNKKFTFSSISRCCSPLFDQLIAEKLSLIDQKELFNS